MIISHLCPSYVFDFCRITIKEVYTKANKKSKPCQSCACAELKYNTVN